MRLIHLSLALLLIATLPLVHLDDDAGFRVGMAWADDGDSGDGDDGDDGDEGDSSSGSPAGGRDNGARSGASEGIGLGEIRNRVRNLFQRQPAPRPARAPAPVRRPVMAPNEIITRDLSPEDTAALVAQGFGLLEAVDLTSLATTARRFSLPQGTTMEQARLAIQALPTGEVADRNHYYRTSTDIGAASDEPEPCEGEHCVGRAVIGWPQDIGPMGCGAPVTLGMVDTGVNPEHEALAGADLQVTRVAPEDYAPSDAIHGTAVAAILVGDPASRAPGLLPGLPLIAVDAFEKQAGDERADAFALVRALDYLARSGADVINLSLAGPPNDVLEETLRQLAERGIIIVAAAGNGGPNAPPAYPAAYDSVIAVTAVDRSGRAYRRAGRGAYVELAAQGVEVWTAASIRGARWQTGTSFAAPFVTAAAALWRQTHPEMSPAEIRAAMAVGARDEGSEGRDEVFGYGILDLGQTCPGPALPRILATE